MKVAVLGSGFGLYGYFPALAQQGAQVILLDRYKSVIERRRELQRFAHNIVWVHDENAALDSAEAVVLARRPSDQTSLIDEIVRRSHLSRVLLEKPIGVTPESAGRILDRLSRSAKIVRIGYTFRYNPWAERLLSAGANNGPIEIEWLFTANHYEADLANWKRHVSEGGGVVRFFGIHLIALLSKLGCTKVDQSQVQFVEQDEASRWQANFAGAGLPPCRVTVDSRSSERSFRVRSTAVTAQLNDPFDEHEPQFEIDRRVAGLRRLCEDFLSATTQEMEWYRSSIRLWDEVERTSQRMRAC